MDPESGQSDRQGQNEEEQVHTISWLLKNVHQDHQKEQIQGELVMPSNIPKMYKDAWTCLPVMLDLHADDAKTVPGLNIMRNSTSRNILHARLILKGTSRKGPLPKGPSRILAWVEPFAGNLEDYLKSKDFGISVKDPESKVVFPTPLMKSALTQVFLGIEDLRLSGVYHGNFSLAGTYYVIDKKSCSLEVKLCNFIEKQGRTYNMYLAEDWRAVLAGLKQIRGFAETLKSKFPNLDCCQLDALIDVMGDINMTNAEIAFKARKQKPFFWGKEERKKFFISDIPLHLSKSDFYSKVKKAKFITLPWNKSGFHGFLALMNKYRLNRGDEPYDVKCRVDFVKFISGLYTHELELKTEEMVDLTVKVECPDLCYDLYALLPDAKTLNT